MLKIVARLAFSTLLIFSAGRLAADPLSSFQSFVNANITQNSQNKITGQSLNYALSSIVPIFNAMGRFDTSGAFHMNAGTVPNCIGDSGAGGLNGGVPAPAAGDFAAHKLLGADCKWGVPPLPPVFSGDRGLGGKSGLVPAPAIGDAGKFLSANGSWSVPPVPANVAAVTTLASYGGTTSVAQGVGSIAAGSSILTLTSPADFAVGQGVRINHAGDPFVYGAPASVTATPCQNPYPGMPCQTGSTTYNYAVAACDGVGGVGAAVATSTTTGYSTLGTVAAYSASVYNQWANTGNGTITPANTVLAGAKNGVYQIVFNSSTTFNVSGPVSGTVGSGTVGTPFANQIQFNIAQGSTPFAAGDRLGVSVNGAGNFIRLNWTQPSPAPPCYVIFRNGAPIDYTVGTTWQDWGQPAMKAEDWLPASPPAAPLNDWLLTTVTAISGGQATLADAAGGTVPGAPLIHDNTPNLNAALLAGRTVIVAPGTYQFSGNVRLGNNNVLVGTDRAASTLKLTTGLAANGAVTGTSVADTAVRDVTIDANGFTSGLVTAVYSCTFCTNPSTYRTRVLNYDKFGYIINASSNWDFDTNVCVRATTAITQNECALATTASGPNPSMRIVNNRSTNSGMEFQGAQGMMTGNIVYGWAFGAGLVTDQESTTTGWIVMGNIATGGVFNSLDINNTASEGAELWAPYSVVAANFFSFTGGPGIAAGGSRSALTGNVLLSNAGAGLRAIYQDNSYNFGGSTVTGNVSTDLGGGAGTQNYGYEEVGPQANVNVALGSNYFNQNRLNPTRFAGLQTSEYRPSFSTCTGIGAIGSLAAGASTGLGGTVSLPGAKAGGPNTPPSIVTASFYGAPAGVYILGKVVGDNQVAASAINLSGSAANLTTGRLCFEAHAAPGYENY